MTAERGPRAAGRPDHARHDDARGSARSTGWSPGPCTPPPRRCARRCRSSGTAPGRPAGLVGLLHVPARRGRRLRRLRHQPRPGRRRTWPTSPCRAPASARAFGIEPRVAMISFSTGTSGSGADVDKVRRGDPDRARARARPGWSTARCSTTPPPSPRSRAARRPDSPVAGRATVFVFPDLNTGNTTYKAVQRSADVVSIGPMLQGLAKPVNDLSPRRPGRGHRLHDRADRHPGRAGGAGARSRRRVSGTAAARGRR